MPFSLMRGFFYDFSLRLSEPDDTNFEDEWGMWKQGTNDDFDWELRSGGTPTLRTGPDHDHTTGDGMKPN